MLNLAESKWYYPTVKIGWLYKVRLEWFNVWGFVSFQCFPSLNALVLQWNFHNSTSRKVRKKISVNHGLSLFHFRLRFWENLCTWSTLDMLACPERPVDIGHKWESCQKPQTPSYHGYIFKWFVWKWNRFVYVRLLKGCQKSVLASTFISKHPTKIGPNIESFIGRIRLRNYVFIEL